MLVLDKSYCTNRRLNISTSKESNGAYTKNGIDLHWECAIEEIRVGSDKGTTRNVVVLYSKPIHDFIIERRNKGKFESLPIHMAIHNYRGKGDISCRSVESQASGRFLFRSIDDFQKFLAQNDLPELPAELASFIF